MTEYVTVYRISTVPVTWPFFIPMLMPLCMAIVTTLGKLRFGWKRPDWFLPIAGWVMGLVAAIFAGKHLLDHVAALAAMDSRRHSVVEGVVTKFAPRDSKARLYECFSVETQRFCYSDGVMGVGFEQTRLMGGPVRAGMPVRVAYVGPTILQLEVAKDALSEPVPETPAQRQAKQLQNDPIGQRVQMAFILMTSIMSAWFGLQWKRMMRFWARPPYRPISGYFFRGCCAVSFGGGLYGLAQQIRVYPWNGENWFGTVAVCVAMSSVVVAMTESGRRKIERQDREEAAKHGEV